MFFSCNDFFKLLKVENNVGYFDCIITPFYILNNKRYELYEYELIISSTESFEQYMTIVTGQKFETINKKVLETRENCYIELSGRNSSDITDQILKYLEYLKTNVEMQNEIKNIFNEFDESKMFFAIYH